MTWTTRPRSRGPGGLAFWTAGSGPALVLIHGVGLRSEAWGAMIPALAQKFTVHAVDMPGHGGSPLGGCETMCDFTARFHDYVRVLDGPIRVVGHSMGAMIALELACQNHLKIQGVAVLNAVYRRTPQAALSVLKRANTLDGFALPDPDIPLERWFGSTPTGPDKLASDACHEWLTTGDAKGYQTAYRVFAEHDGPSDADISGLPSPTLFLTGAEDPNSTAQMSQNMASLAPLGTAAIIDNAAHMLPMTHPQAATNHILEVFADHGGSP